MINLAIWAQAFGICLKEKFERVWNTGLQKNFRTLQQNLKYSGGSLKGQNPGRNVGSGGPAPEMSEQNKDPIGVWVRGHVCALLAKNTASSYPYSENLSEV